MINYNLEDIFLKDGGLRTDVSTSRWQYYSLSDQKNSVKLPIIYKGRNATNEYGVDKIYNGDLIYVQGYNEAFKVTEYENETIRYLPFI